MKKGTFFITTPIYYTNAIPHIGNSYASLISDVIARYKRLEGYEVKFSTGVDENSQKAVLKAQELGMGIMEYLDDMASKHQEIWDGLDISYTDFIRTTDPKHHAFVKEILEKTFAAGYIYKGYYEGLYCIGCESFKKPEELNEGGCCPDHLTKPEVIKEENYFFALSKFQKQLEEYYSANPEFTIPNHRFAEMQTFLSKGLEDFSISRNKKIFGIPLPFDENQVTYVWYDALLNYLTVCQGGDERFWPADLHVVGKEIARFHVIYWPAMLLAAGYKLDELPKNVMVTGFLTIDGQKISKSLGNAINPVEFSQKHSRDLMLLYLLNTFNIGYDGDFSENQAVLMYNAKLANNIGNLLNRFIVLSLKIGGQISGVMDKDVSSKKDLLIKRYFTSMDKYNLKEGLEAAFEFGDELNKFVDTAKPWNLNSETQKDEIESILYTLGEGLKIIAVMLNPFFYVKMDEMLTRIGLDPSVLKEIGIHDFLDSKTSFNIKEKGEALYPRI